MAAYHAVWDLVYLFGEQWDWYKGGWAFLAAEHLLDLYFPLGLLLAAGAPPAETRAHGAGRGAAVTLVTALAMPESRVVFGVLTLLGARALLLIPLEKRRACARGAGPCRQCGAVRPDAGCKPGLAGFGGLHLLRLPDRLYHGLFATWLGFMEPGFFSTDYFSLLP